MSTASGMWSPIATKISSSFAATSRSIARSGMHTPSADKQNVGGQNSASPLSQRDLERKYANVNFFDLIIVMKSELEVKNHNFRLKNYESTFLGSEAMKWLVTAEYASNTTEAAFIGAELMNHGHIYNAVDEDDDEFKNGYKLYRFAMDDRANSAKEPVSMAPLSFMDQHRVHASIDSDDDVDDGMDSQGGLRKKQTSGDASVDNGVERFDVSDLFSTTFPNRTSSNKLSEGKDGLEPRSMGQGKYSFKLPLGNFTTDDFSNVSSPRSTRSLPKTPQAQAQAQTRATGKSECYDSPLRSATDISGPRSIKFSVSPRIVSLKKRSSNDSASLCSVARDSPLASTEVIATNPSSNRQMSHPLTDLSKAEVFASTPLDVTSESLDRSASKTNMKIKKIVLKPLEKMKTSADGNGNRSLSRQSSNPGAGIGLSGSISRSTSQAGMC